MIFITYQSYKNIISLLSGTRNLFTRSQILKLHSSFEKTINIIINIIIILHKILLTSENCNWRIFSLFQKRFKLKPKEDLDERSGCMLLPITMLVWLYHDVFPTFIAKIDVPFQTVRACLGKSEIHKKAWR